MANKTNTTLARISKPERSRLLYYEKLYDLIDQNAKGECRAKTKYTLRETVINMWDQTCDIKMPTHNWYEANHSKFYEWCHFEGKLVIDCQQGLFVPETETEINEWQNKIQKIRLEGTIKSNNLKQDLIKDTYPEAMRYTKIEPTSRVHRDL